MSTQPISFDGTDLARHVPPLAEFYDLLLNLTASLEEVAACRWADGAPADDEMTAQARATVQQLFTEYLGPIYAIVGESVGLQGDKLDLVRRIGENTEAGNAETAGGWGGGRHG